MANHVYFNISIEGITEEQHSCLFKSEETERPHWDENEPPIKMVELVEVHEQPFMSNLDKEYDDEGWIKNSWDWYVNNCGAKWVCIEEWEHNMITGHSAWSQPVAMVENMLEYASNRFGIELSAKMTYEDEFRNFVGVDDFETYSEEGEWYCMHSENYLDGGELTELLEEKLKCDVSDDDFDWWEEYKATGLVPSECVDEMVYNFFDTGELNWVN
tara:strand:+ start:13856 stop:14500 length:645 start_codon:yes stop_codon:yes gene_type:complete